MKLIEALRNVDMSNKNRVCLSLDEFASSFGLYGFDMDCDLFDERCSGYWVSTHMCTDTQVGMQAIYLDSELVAYTTQLARKCDYNIFYLDEKSAEKMRVFLLSIDSSESSYCLSSEEDLLGDIGDGFRTNYSSELLSSLGYVDGRQVTMSHGKYGDTSRESKVVFTDNLEESVVLTESILQPYRLR